MHRRQFLGIACGLAYAASVKGVEPNDTFDPDAWLRQRKMGRLRTVTPQSNKPLQPIAAQTLAEWQKERLLYEKALRELIGSWPQKRPALAAGRAERP